MNKQPQVGIVMGSDSDLAIMKLAADVLAEFKIESEITVASAHRTPDRAIEYAKKARDRGLKVIIAGAGGAAHLPGVLAALTVLPVIGVPIKSSNLNGMDSLLSIVQMPEGIPVATVGINAAKNAGLLAAKIIGTSDEKISKELDQYRARMKDKVEAKAKKLEELGYEKYLQSMQK